jgi:hypothetical protein
MDREVEAAERPSADAATCDTVLRAAIAQRRLISFELDRLPRIAEPHDYGVAAGERRLLFHQVGGQSRSGDPYGWRLVATEKMTKVRMLDAPFGGSRPAPSGRHKRWDTILASVSMPPGPPSRDG